MLENYAFSGTKINKEIKLDLACGLQKAEGYIGVDLLESSHADIILDLLKFPWPFEDNSVDDIFCAHFIEHIPKSLFVDDLLFKFFDECYRILKPGKFLKIVTPYYSSIRSIQDPTHHRSFGEASFCYFNKKWREENNLGHYPIKCNFSFTYGLDFHPEYETRTDEHKIFAVLHYLNVVRDIHVQLIKE